MSTKSDRVKLIRETKGERKQCPVCKDWILCLRGRLALDGHIVRDHPDSTAAVGVLERRAKEDWEVPLA